MDSERTYKNYFRFSPVDSKQKTEKQFEWNEIKDRFEEYLNNLYKSRTYKIDTNIVVDALKKMSSIFPNFGVFYVENGIHLGDNFVHGIKLEVRYIKTKSLHVSLRFLRYKSNGISGLLLNRASYPTRVVIAVPEKYYNNQMKSSVREISIQNVDKVVIKDDNSREGFKNVLKNYFPIRSESFIRKMDEMSEQLHRMRNVYYLNKEQLR